MPGPSAPHRGCFLCQGKYQDHPVHQEGPALTYVCREGSSASVRRRVQYNAADLGSMIWYSDQACAVCTRSVEEGHSSHRVLHAVPCTADHRGVLGTPMKVGASPTGEPHRPRSTSGRDAVMIRSLCAWRDLHGFDTLARWYCLHRGIAYCGKIDLYVGSPIDSKGPANHFGWNVQCQKLVPESPQKQLQGFGHLTAA